MKKSIIVFFSVIITCNSVQAMRWLKKRKTQRQDRKLEEQKRRIQQELEEQKRRIQQGLQEIDAYLDSIEDPALASDLAMLLTDIQAKGTAQEYNAFLGLKEYKYIRDKLYKLKNNPNYKKDPLFKLLSIPPKSAFLY